jgi:hypothetical protein
LLFQPGLTYLVRSSGVFGGGSLLDRSPSAPIFSRPESRQDYPPNLSILISGGKENNRDALSNGE